MTRITENDIMPNNEKNDVPLPKKMTWITENDIMPNNEKMMFLCLKKWHESQKMTLLKKKWHES